MFCNSLFSKSEKHHAKTTIKNLQCRTSNSFKHPNKTFWFWWITLNDQFVINSSFSLDESMYSHFFQHIDICTELIFIIINYHIHLIMKICNLWDLLHLNVIFLNSWILLKSVLLMRHFLLSISNLFCSYWPCFLSSLHFVTSALFFCLWLAVKPLYYKTFSVFSSPASYLLQIFIAIQEEMQQNKLFLYKLIFLLLIWMRNVYKMCYAGLRKCLSGSKKKYLCGNQTE